MLYQDLASFWMLLDQKGRALLPFIFSHFLIDFRMIAVLSMRKKRHSNFQASIHIVHLCTASFHKRPSATNHPSSAQAGSESNTTSPFHSKNTAQVPRCRDSNSFNTLIGQKTAKTCTQNSHQKLSQYSRSHMGVHSTQLIAPWYF